MPIRTTRIRLRMRYLILFLVILLSCTGNHPSSVRILWRNDQAIGLSKPGAIANNSADSLDQRIAVRLMTDGDRANVFGSFTTEGNEILFEPLVPLTRGLHYEILVDNKVIEEVAIPPPDPAMIPRLLKIYPTSDTVPENLLKIYLKFDKPMQEGQSVGYLTLLKNDKDTVKGAFLDLQPELWNADRTMLTVWLDPGRIKRDLQPNRRYGPPLKMGNHYTLTVSDHWKSVAGAALLSTGLKNFVIALRDSLPPDPGKWTLQSPKAGSRDALTLDFSSPLDYSLLNTTLHVIDKNEKEVQGQWLTGKQERNVSFTPRQSWEAGVFKLQVETRLEDLAGNNLNRPFEVDLTSGVGRPSASKVISIEFSVRD